MIQFMTSAHIMTSKWMSSELLSYWDCFQSEGMEKTKARILSKVKSVV